MRVLVVDDEPALRESLRRGLVAGGWAVDTAGDGEAGLEMAAGEEYDVVVLDIMMPRRNGYEVVREMRRREIWTPVLMLTAKDGEYDEADAFDLGADDYLVKPFSFVVLEARLRALVRRGAPNGPRSSPPVTWWWIRPPRRSAGVDSGSRSPRASTPCWST